MTCVNDDVHEMSNLRNRTNDIILRKNYSIASNFNSM